MRYYKYILSLLLCFNSLCLIKAQQRESFTGDTVLFGRFHGTETYTYIYNEGLPVKNGEYKFQSKLLQQLNNDSSQLENLQITGAYKNGKREGDFTYVFSNYDFSIQNLNDARSLSLDYSLNGYKRLYILNYKQGAAEGYWKSFKTTAHDGQFGRRVEEVSIKFFKGLIIDRFKGDFKDDENGERVTITGQVNSGGFFHGKVSLNYFQNGVNVSETREYDSGYLMSLVKKAAKTDDTLQYVIYEDVMDRLEQCRDTTEKKHSQFMISDEGFGVEFDNGYNPSSRKRKVQKEGNAKLNELFNSFNRFHDSGSFEAQLPQYNLTGRFKYVYPHKDDSLANYLYPKVKAKREELNVFLNSPKFIIAKERSDSMAFAYAYIEKAAEKTRAVLDVVNKVKTGYFDFLNRNSYYKAGVPQLKTHDTITYTYSGKSLNRVFDPGMYVTSPDSLLPALEKYFST